MRRTYPLDLVSRKEKFLNILNCFCRKLKNSKELVIKVFILRPTQLIVVVTPRANLELTLLYPCHKKADKKKKSHTKIYQKEVNFKSRILDIDLT